VINEYSHRFSWSSISHFRNKDRRCNNAEKPKDRRNLLEVENGSVTQKGSEKKVHYKTKDDAMVA